jgi:hypothetical protein
MTIVVNSTSHNATKVIKIILSQKKYSFQLLKIFTNSKAYGTRRFNTTFTGLSIIPILSSVKPNPHIDFLKNNSNIVLPSMHILPRGLFLVGLTN